MQQLEITETRKIDYWIGTDSSWEHIDAHFHFIR